jgi:hypothetical protein
MMGILRGFKQRRNWGGNYFPVRFIAGATGLIKFSVTFKEELILLDATTAAFIAAPSG